MIRYTRRRRAVRRGLHVRCQAIHLEGFFPVGSRILDLSHQGAQLACDVALVEGDELVVSFTVAGRTIDAIAKVRNVSEDLRHVGLEFTEIDWEGRAGLFVGLSGVPPRIPSGRPSADYAATVRTIGRA